MPVPIVTALLAVQALKRGCEDSLCVGGIDADSRCSLNDDSASGQLPLSPDTHTAAALPARYFNALPTRFLEKASLKAGLRPASRS
jgi:hypothetical protein